MYILKKKFNVLVLMVNIFLLLLLITGNTLACTCAICPPGTTKDGSMIFAKSGQRPNEEAFFLANYPGGTHAPGEMVKIFAPNAPDVILGEIPQASITYAVRGDQAYDKWGFEEGMNEWGVTIGNVAVRHNLNEEDVAERDAALDPDRPMISTNWDILRLALERGKTAREAVKVAIDIKMNYGMHTASSHAYAIVDEDEAWILELPPHGYIAWRIPDDLPVAFTNIPTIRTDYDIISPNLISDAIKNGWHKEGDEFDFSFSYMSGDDYTPRNEIKRARVEGLIYAENGNLDVQYIMDVMRDTRKDDWSEPRFMPQHFYRLVDETTPSSSTAGTVVAHLRKDLPDSIKHLYWRAVASPKTSVFTPLYWGADVPEEWEYMALNEFDPKSPWWAFDVLDRMSRVNYEVFNPIVANVWKSVEERNVRQAHLIEKQVIKLTEEGKNVEVTKLLSDFHRENLDREWNIAKGLAKALQELYKVYPGRIISFYDYDSSNIKAGLMDLFEMDLYE